MKRIDLTGQVYTNLTVKSFSRVHTTPNGSTKSVWFCICSCGKEVEVAYEKLVRGIIKSCGCGNYTRDTKFKRIRELLGNRFERSYKHWANIKTRCYNQNSRYFKDYGGRGITMCKSWLSFENFFADMGERPEGMTLDRIDVNGNYCKENCRWVDAKLQCFNRRKSERNKTGKTGVFKTANGKWVAKIRKSGKSVHLGTFEVLDDAIAARLAAEIEVYGETKE